MDIKRRQLEKVDKLRTDEEVEMGMGEKQKRIKAVCIFDS